MPAEQERQSLPALAGWKMWHGLAAALVALVPRCPGSHSWGSVHEHHRQHTTRAEPLISLSGSKAWLQLPKLSTGLCYVPQTLALLHPILSAQTSSGYHLPDPAVAQPQPWKSQPAARKDCKGEGLVEERKDTA